MHCVTLPTLFSLCQNLDQVSWGLNSGAQHKQCQVMGLIPRNAWMEQTFQQNDYYWYMYVSYTEQVAGGSVVVYM